jgi:radical SAM superfamily enzyme YgiQ (UPF0313 family)
MGLALLGAILEREGYEVKVADANLKPLNLDVFIYWAKTADAIGLTAMTPTIDETLKLAKIARQYSPKVRIMLGGVHATLLPEETLKACPEIDVIVIGEGDKAILDVLGGDIAGIYERMEKIDMDDLPFLGYHLLDWQSYRPHPPHGRALPWLPLITSRGCPFSCSYCSKGVFGNKFRAQSPSRVVDEMVYMQRKFGVREITFYDDVFTLDKKRIYRIAEEILKRNIKLCWACETRVDLVDKGLLKMMRESGCFCVSFGIESASQSVLDVIGKHITVEQSEEAVRMAKAIGIQIVGYFMIGSPNETPDTIRKTIDFAKKLKLDYVQFSITTPLPRTSLYEYYKNGNKNSDIQERVIRNLPYLKVRCLAGETLNIGLVELIRSFI